MDKFTGGTGNDTFNATNADLGVLDSIAGGDGTDTLNLVDSVSIPARNITATGIETVVVNSTAGSVGALAADAKVATKQQVTYSFTGSSTTYGTSLGVGPVKVTVGGASIIVGTETSATAQTIDKVVAALNQLAGDAFVAVNTDTTGLDPVFQYRRYV